MDVIGAGPRAVAGILEQAGASVDIVDYERVLTDKAMLADYDVLMVSVMSCDLNAAKRLAAIWRGISDGPLIVGGPGALEYGKLLRYGYQVAVVGEAERPLRRLLEAGLMRGDLQDLDMLRGVRGLAFVGKRGETVFTGIAEHPTAQELNYKHATNSLSTHSYKAIARVYVEVVRGCSNFCRPAMRLPGGGKCTNCALCREGPLEARVRCPLGIPAGCGYCSVPQLYGPSRSRDVSVIAREVKELVNLGVKRITLSAPDILDYGRDWLVAPQPLTDPRNPPANLEALERLFEALRREVPEWEAGEVSILVENVKPNLVTEPVARLLSNYFRGTPIHMGVETGDPEHARLIGRPALPDEAAKAVELLSRYGMRPYVYFMYGLPGESKRTVRKTIQLMRRVIGCGAEKITAYRFTPLPATAFEGYRPRLSSLSRRVAREAARLNRLAKDRLVGTVLKAVVAGRYSKGGLSGTVLYPLSHGPVVLVKDTLGGKGELVKVRIVRVINDRMVEGKLVSG